MPIFLAVGVGEMFIGNDVHREGGCKVFAMTLIAYEHKLGFIRISFNLFLYIQSWTETREFWLFKIESSKLDMLKELWICVISAYRWCLISLVLALNPKGPQKWFWVDWTEWMRFGLMETMFEAADHPIQCNAIKAKLPFNLSSRISWSIMSNTADKSRSVIAVQSWCHSGEWEEQFLWKGRPCVLTERAYRSQTAGCVT